MRAVVLEQYGDPDVLELEDVDDPEAGPDEVVVDVVATALNRADVLQRMGGYPGPPMAHEIPGLEFAGRVSATGARVREAKVGAPVMGIVGGGAYAEKLVTHERMLLAVPHEVALPDAAAIPEVFITAWDALVLQGGLTSGRRALVHAGASGVGSAAIQVCNALGAPVAVTASATKLDACREVGADLAIDREAEDFAEAVSEWSGGDGVDVVLDVVGGEYLTRNLQSLRTGGRIVQVGVLGEGMATFPLGLLLPKRATLVGTVLRARPLEEKIAVTRRFAREMLPLFATGALRPVIDTRFPLERVADAHRRMEQNANVGKIVIDV